MRTKAIFFLILLIFMPGFVLAEEERQARTAHLDVDAGQTFKDPLVIAIDKDYPPQTFLNIDGQPTGIFVDIWRLWSRKTGKDIVFLEGNWNDSLANLKNGKADIHSGLFYSDTRAKWIGFSQPFYGVGSYLFSLRESHKIDEQRDLAGKKIGAMLGSFQEEYLRQEYPKVIVVTFSNREKMIRAVLDKRIDALLAEAPAMTAQLDRFGLTGQFHVGNSMFRKSFHAGVLKENSLLLLFVDKGFDAISEQEFAEIEKRWIHDPKRQYFKSELVYVLDAIPALIWIAKDPECRVITGNRYVNDLFSVANDTNVSQTAAKMGQAVKIIHLKPDGTELQAEELPMQQSIARGKAVRNVEFSYLFPDGRQVFAIGNAVPLFDEHGQIRGSVGAFLDITETKQASARLQKRTQMFLILAIGFVVVLGVMLIVLARMWQAAKRDKEALRESEGRFRAAFDSAQDCVLIWDKEYNYLYANQAAIDHVGTNSDQVIGKNIRDGLGHVPEFMRLWMSRVDKVFETGEELRVQDEQEMQGRQYYTDSILTPIRGTVGKVISVCVVYRDITELKLAEEALRESEEKYRTTLRSTPDTVAISRVEDGRFLELNDGFTRMFGYPREEAIGKTVTELGLYHLPTDRDLLVEALSTQEEANELEFTYRRKDGTLFKGMQSARSIRFGDEDCLISVVKDISLLDNAQKTLQGEKVLSEEYINSLPGLFYVFDEKRFVRWNSEWNRITGYSDEELSGMYGTDFFEGEDRTLIRKRMLKVFREGAAEAEAKLVAKDGRRISCYFSGLRKKLNGKDHLVGFGIDITERKQAEEALRKSEDRLARSKKMESLGLLAGGVAHDLNNILSGIVTYPELLLMNLPEDSPLRKPIKTIQESGMRAADVVEDLLTIARGIATGKEVLNLNTIVTEYLRSAEYQKLEKTHSFVSCRTELDPDLLNMSASPTHIKKVLMNLVTNASEAIESSGTVIISTANRYLDEPLMGYEDVRMGEYSVLSVSDNGSGISPEDLERIFEPFYTKKVMGRSGTGLGLAVVWNTVQDHKGYINIKSSEQGTVFELYFPVTRDKVAPEKEEVPMEDYLGHGEKILVVDDEERQREIAGVLLAELGYVAESVSSGEEAIEYVKEHPVDLIVLDMVMPKGINGRETYEEIIKIRPAQRAIIASGYAKTKEVDTAQELGAGKYIKKPYTLAKVGLAVKEELEKQAVFDLLLNVTLTYINLVPFRGIDVGGESEPFRVSSTLPPNSITRDTITYCVDDQGHRLLTKCRRNSTFIFSHPDIPVADLRAVWNEPAANERRNFTMKKKNIYSNQSQELFTLFEEAGNGAKVMCVPIDYAKKDHVAMLCNGNGHILRKPFSVKNSPEGIVYLTEQVTRSCKHRQIDLKHVFFGGEDVGSYAENFVNTLRSGGWIVAGVNAHDAKEQRANMQASTDRLDLMGIASMLLNRRGNCSPAQSGIYRNLRTVVRHRKKLVAMSTEVKNRMHTVVDRLFPGFLDEKKSGILSFSKSSLYLMEDRFSPRQIRRRKQPKLIEILHRYGTKKAEDTAKKLKGYADCVLGTPNEYISTFQLSLTQHVNHFRCLRGIIEQLEHEIAVWLAQTEGAFLTSIRGIGIVLAAGTAGEIGNPHEQEPLNNLVSYSGIIPRVKQTGGSEGKTYTGKVAKRCNRILKDYVVQSGNHMGLHGPEELMADYKRREAAGQHADFGIGRRYLRTAMCLMRTSQIYMPEQLRNTKVQPEERAGYYLSIWPYLRKKWKKAGALDAAFEKDRPLGQWRCMVQELYEIKLKL